MQHGKRRLQPLAPCFARRERSDKIDGRRRTDHAFVILRSGFSAVGRVIGGGQELRKLDGFQQRLPAIKHADVRAIKLISRAGQKVAIHCSYVYEFVRRGNFEPNLERVRGLLKARRDAMLEALEQHMPDGAAWSRPEGGYFIWLDLPGDTPDLAAAEAAGVTFVPGTDFFAEGSGSQSMRLAFSFVSPEEIAEGVSVLGNLVRAAAPAAL